MKSRDTLETIMFFNVNVSKAEMKKLKEMEYEHADDRHAGPSKSTEREEVNTTKEN